MLVGGLEVLRPERREPTRVGAMMLHQQYAPRDGPGRHRVGQGIDLGEIAAKGCDQRQADLERPRSLVVIEPLPQSLPLLRQLLGAVELAGEAVVQAES